MEYKQLIQANVSLYEKAGLCLSYARRVFGRPAVEPTAWDAWQRCRYKHTDRNFPKGVSFPVWFDHWGDYGGGWLQYGHVAVVHTDGRVYSSPLTGYGHVWFASVDDLVRAFEAAGANMKYVGWSEDISGGRVITKEVDMVENNETTYLAWKKLGVQIRNRVLSRDEFKTAAVGRTWKEAMRILSNNKEADIATSDQELGKKARTDKWRDQILDGQRKLNDAQAALKKSNAALDQAKTQYEISGQLKRQLEQTEKKNADLILQIEALNAEKADRDKKVESVWQTIGDLLGKLFRR